MTEAAQGRPEPGGDRDRIVNLGDGVFAIAITLLVLDIRVPDIRVPDMPENMVASRLRTKHDPGDRHPSHTMI